MSNQKLSKFYGSHRYNYHSRTDALRFLLMPFVYIVLLGFPGKYGGYISTYSNFVAQVFYILYGFFTLVPDKDKRYRRLQRGLKRAFKFFIIMFISLSVLSILYLIYLNTDTNLFGNASAIKHAVFNFFILNVWPLPVGNSIWFVQSLVYAYLFFMFAEKTGLSKYYIPILIILALFTLFTGEFAAFSGFPYRGYNYVPGGAVTRAIPYMLVGMLLRKYVDKLASIPRYIYIILFPVGLLAAIGEIEFLSHIGKLVYVGHTIGFGIMALSLCCFTLSKAKVEKSFLTTHGRNYSRRLYAFCQPVALFCWIATAIIKPEYLPVIKEYSSIISFVISFALSFVIGLAIYSHSVSKKHKSSQESEI